MLEVRLLGTGGMVPLPGRYLTALMIRYLGRMILIDCGEGTQVAIRAAGLGFKRIDVICLTYFHADHIAGLPGLLLTIGNAGRTEPLTIIGPQYVKQVVESLSVIAPQLPYGLAYIEAMESQALLSVGALSVFALPVEHWTPCYAYKIELARPGEFDPEKAAELKIPVRLWSVLRSGEIVEANGRRVHPSEVMGDPRAGIRLCYATDLRPSGSLTEFIRNADLFVGEGMYGDPQMLEKAIEHKHCLFAETAAMARAAGIKELWLTHFSPSIPDPGEFLQIATDLFDNTFVDKTEMMLRFPA